MPVENSRLKGFYKLSVKERRDLVAELAGLDQEAVNALAATGELTEAAADGAKAVRSLANQMHQAA